MTEGIKMPKECNTEQLVKDWGAVLKHCGVTATPSLHKDLQTMVEESRNV